MAATVKVKIKTERPLMTIGAVLEEVKDHLPVSNIQALYRCGEARDWYPTFDSPSIVDEVGDTHFIGKSGAQVEVERIDKRRVRFRVQRYPFFMDIGRIEQHMYRFWVSYSVRIRNSKLRLSLDEDGNDIGDNDFH